MAQSTTTAAQQHEQRQQQREAEVAAQQAAAQKIAEQHKKEQDEALKRVGETEAAREELTERAMAAETDADRLERANRDMKTIRDMAESATGHLPRAGEGAMPLSVEAVRQGDEAMVKMQFDRPVMLTLDGYRAVRFAAGIQEVPASLADDPYLAANGVTRV